MTNSPNAKADIADLEALISQFPIALYLCASPSGLIRLYTSGLIRLYNRRAVDLWGQEPVLGEQKYSGALRLLRTDGSLLPHAETRLAGHDVVEAATGTDGIEMARRHQPEVVLVDIGLPDIDGYQVARRLRQDAEGRFRLIALTGYGQARDRALSHAAGFDAHLLKPLDPSTLEAAIQQLD